MTRPPERAEKSLFSKSSLCAIAFFGLYIAAATIGIFVIALNIWGNETATTMTFMTISFLELFQSFNVRSGRGSAFKGFFSNKILLATVAGGVILNVLLCVTPLSNAFGLVKLNAVQWVTAFGVSLSILPAGEIYKAVLRLITGKKSGYTVHMRGVKAKAKR